MNINTVIEDYLLEQGVKPGHKGFTYLTSVINKCIENPKALNSMTSLYKGIAKEFNSTVSRVERAIRYSRTSDMRNKDYIAMCTLMIKRRIAEIKKAPSVTAE
ncbi:MAG: sporulation initiation factor Spo0A C-terminal domain-containing protein [Eubacteriaceae bacterium]